MACGYCCQTCDGVVDDLVDELNEIASGRFRPERPGFATVIQLAEPGHGTDGGQARRESVWLDAEIAGDGSGKDAFRGGVGGAPVSASRGWRGRLCWSRCRDGARRDLGGVGDRLDGRGLVAA